MSNEEIDFEEIERKNKENEERLRKEREKANKSITRRWGLRK